MQGWNNLKSYEQLDIYYKWVRENRETITAELKEEYCQFCACPSSDIVWRTDFGGCVGIPLFILTILWIVSAQTEYQWFIVAGMVVFGFWLRYYQKHIVDAACQYFFWDTKKKVRRIVK